MMNYTKYRPYPPMQMPNRKLEYKCEGTRREQLWKYYIIVQEATEHR